MNQLRPMNPLEQLSLGELRQRRSLKWRTYPDTVLPLWVAEMDVPLAEPVANALRDAIDRGDTGYPVEGVYAEAVTIFAARRWGWHGAAALPASMVADVMVGITEIIRLITAPGDVVVVTAPVYPPFYAFVEHEGRHIVEASLDADGRIDFDSLEIAFAEAARRGPSPVFLMSNPHNPTGVVHRPHELARLARLAQHHGIRVISDEIHAPLVLEKSAVFTPYLTVPGSENAFAVVSASKAWNLAGIKAALIIAGEDAADDLARLPEEVSHGPSHLGVLAHAAAFIDGEAWLDALLDGLRENRALLGDLLAEHLPMIRHRPPEGTYLAWLDCRPLELHDPNDPGRGGVVSEVSGPAQFFVDHAGVALSSGHVFGRGGTGFVRLNFATSSTILRTAVTQMGDAVAARS